jgi:hypothetical protein
MDASPLNFSELRNVDDQIQKLGSLRFLLNMSQNPEVGKRVRTGTFDTNVHDEGAGAPLLLIHGSGPGVSAWADWRLVLPALATQRRVIAPDIGEAVNQKAAA